MGCLFPLPTPTPPPRLTEQGQEIVGFFSRENSGPLRKSYKLCVWGQPTPHSNTPNKICQSTTTQSQTLPPSSLSKYGEVVKDHQSSVKTLQCKRERFKISHSNFWHGQRHPREWPFQNDQQPAQRLGRSGG